MPIILLNKERQRLSLAKLNQITLQNLVKTLRIFHKMICKSKTFLACDKSFSLLHSKIFVNRFCFTDSNPAWMQILRFLYFPKSFKARLPLVKMLLMFLFFLSELHLARPVYWLFINFLKNILLIKYLLIAYVSM